MATMRNIHTKAEPRFIETMAAVSMLLSFHLGETVDHLRIKPFSHLYPCHVEPHCRDKDMNSGAAGFFSLPEKRSRG
jgi:hypothetical protein